QFPFGTAEDSAGRGLAGAAAIHEYDSRHRRRSGSCLHATFLLCVHSLGPMSAVCTGRLAFGLAQAEGLGEITFCYTPAPSLLRILRMTVRLAVVMDPIGSINFKKDTTLAMLLAAQKRGWELWYMEMSDMYLAQN